MRKDGKPEYWHCFVGPADQHELSDGCDAPMRIAVREAFEKITGRCPRVISSGWGVSEEEKEAMIDLDIATSTATKVTPRTPASDDGGEEEQEEAIWTKCLGDGKVHQFVVVNKDGVRSYYWDGAEITEDGKPTAQEDGVRDMSHPLGLAIKDEGEEKPTTCKDCMRYNEEQVPSQGCLLSRRSVLAQNFEPCDRFNRKPTAQDEGEKDEEDWTITDKIGALRKAINDAGAGFHIVDLPDDRYALDEIVSDAARAWITDIESHIASLQAKLADREATLNELQRDHGEELAEKDKALVDKTTDFSETVGEILKLKKRIEEYRKNMTGVILVPREQYEATNAMVKAASNLRSYLLYDPETEQEYETSTVAHADVNAPGFISVKARTVDHLCRELEVALSAHDKEKEEPEEPEEKHYLEEGYDA